MKDAHPAPRHIVIVWGQVINVEEDWGHLVQAVPTTQPPNPPQWVNSARLAPQANPHAR